MLINTDSKLQNDKQLSNEVKKDENYFPNIVHNRLYHRKKVKKFSIIIFISNSIYFILGVIFNVAAYITRFFIYNPDDFWKQIMNRPILLKLQRYCAGGGIYLCFFSLFSIMDNIVIYILLNKGGLKRRLQYDIYILLVLEVINFCFSLYSICYFRNILILFPIYFIHSTFALVITVLYFLLIKKTWKSENLFFLSIERLTKYIEYIEEFQKVKKLKKV